MIGKEGDYSILQETLNHAKLKDCEICQKHAAEYCQKCKNQSPLTNTMELLTQISITTSGDQKDIPKRLKLELTGQFHEQLNKFRGEYILQEQMINRFPYWRHTMQKIAIWYNNAGECWSIGYNKDIGTSKWVFAGPAQITKWPNEILSDWRCHTQVEKFNTTEDTFSLKIICEYYIQL